MAALPGSHTQNRSGTKALTMRCIVWCGQGAVLDGQLQSALKSRQELRATVVSSCFAALAELLVGEAGEQRVLVLQEPRTLAGAAEVLTRLERHLPHVKVWVFVAEPKPTLRGMRKEDLAGAARAEVVVPALKRVPQVVVVPGIASKLRGQADGWTPRVVGEFDTGVDGPETQLAQVDPPNNSRPVVPPPAAANPSGSSVGNTRPASLLTDEELSMLLANDQDKEHN